MAVIPIAILALLTGGGFMSLMMNFVIGLIYEKSTINRALAYRQAGAVIRKQVIAAMGIDLERVSCYDMRAFINANL
jgi:hypothetical protein